MGAAIPSLQAGLLNQSSAQVIDGSLKFDSGSSNYLNRTPGSAGNRKTWTWSGFVKLTNIGQASRLFSAGADNDNRTVFHYDTSNNTLKL